MAERARRIHLAGVVIVAITAVLLLRLLIPYLAELAFPEPLRARGLRGVSIYYLTLALVPVVLWLVPPFIRALARGAFATHKLVLGKGGFYLRFPKARDIRFRDTVLLSLGPFALDLLVITEITYFVSTPDAQLLGRGLVAIPVLLLLAGFVTSLVPGAWLINALDVRLVKPERGEVVRAAELFERALGPLGAVALLTSFITALHTVDYSYEQALVSLGEWALRLFPPVLASVSVYRLFVEPDVLPNLDRWFEDEGIHVAPSLATDLERLCADLPHGQDSVGVGAADSQPDKSEEA